jgi:CRP/FNR family transcriptional regulator, cyclic AMP receptor protein
MQTLAQIPFFKDAYGIDRFDRRCNWKRYEEGAVIVDYDDDTTDVFFIGSGDVRILIRTPSGKEVILADMKGGEYFGEIAALDNAKRSANVSALTRCDLCIMPAAVFREVIHGFAPVCDKVLAMLVHRIRDLNTRITEHTVLDVRHRLLAELLRLSNPRAGHAGQRSVSPPPFHHVLAARIGCRREQVTRELAKLAKEKAIEKTRGALILKNPDDIKARIDEALKRDG